MHEFNFLSDDVSDADFFEDQTHENVAETLYKLIDVNDNGFTIGLEGSWGSGKSTVISILKKKIKSRSFHYFYFDAWAHEGDHLRRIFLESLISQLDTESDKFKDLKDEISNRKRITTTHTKQYGTDLGKWLAISVLFVPLGVGLVSGVDISQLSFQWGGNPHLLFWLGVILSVMPFWFIIGNVVNLKKSKKIEWKNLFKAKNWAFLESESDNTITRQISEEEERSSIEFEKYFGDIMSEVFKENPSNKLMIVVDNLDRIEANNSLKIWSTLQTFLQQRNPSNSDCQWYRNIWIIVPYDMNGLSKLWNNESILNEDSPSECILGSCAKSFFDKCFQIRIEVPEPVLTGWKNFTRVMLNKAFINWNNEEKEIVFKILKLTRESLGDTPTPREIKNYINQVGILRLHTCEEIPTESIAYYAIHKYLKGTSTKTIQDKLINNQLPKVEDKHFLPPECNKHLAGIVFGVGPEKGQHLLLEPEIEGALQNANGNKLKSLAEIYGDGFWSVFDHHINNLTATGTLFKYSKAVYEGLWSTHEKQCNIFTKKVQESFIRAAFPLPIDECIEDYLPIIKMSSDKTFLDKIWDLVLTDLELKIKNDDDYVFDYETNVKSLEKIVESLGVPLKTHTFSNISHEHWLKWAQAADSQQIPAYQWILPPQSITDDIAEDILPSNPIAAGTKELLIYSINAGISGWKKLPLACKDHIFWNDGTVVDENKPSIEAIDVLVWLTSYDMICRDEIKELLKTGQFHNFVYHYQNKSEIYSALLMAYYFKNELHNIQIPVVGRSEKSVQIMRNVWLIRNATNAKAMLNALKKFNCLNLLWDLVENKDNKLVVDIIGLALDNEVDELFSCSDVLNKLQFVMKLIGDDASDIKDKLVDQLIKHSKIEKEIVASSNIDVSNYSNELLLILKKTNNKSVIDGLASALVGLEKDEWDTYFAEGTYLADLALKMKAKKSDFSLENAYLDSIFEFAEQFVEDDGQVSDWQKNQWSNLVNLMGVNFQKHYKNKITKLLLEKGFVVTNKFYECNRNFFDNQKIYKDGRSEIQNSLEEAVKDDGDFDRLEMLDMILKNDKNMDFVPEKYMINVVSKPLQKLYKNQDEMEKKEILNRLSEKFNVEIKEQTLESEEDVDELGG